MKTITPPIIYGGLCLVLLGTFTGCHLPRHGGHHGLPLPGHHGGSREKPAQKSGPTPSVRSDEDQTPQLVQNEIAPTPEGLLHE